jgi:hypothetical protein
MRTGTRERNPASPLLAGDEPPPYSKMNFLGFSGIPFTRTS